MRTLLFLVAGLSLLLSVAVLAKLFSANYPDAIGLATVAYIVLWLLVAGFNLWTGVARAGYSVVEELPIFLLIFGLPVAVAFLLRRILV